MIRRFLVLALVLLVPALAFAKRQQVAAKSAASLRADANETSPEVAKVKAGDKLTVLSTKGDWANVANAAGKKGWLPLTIVPDAKVTASVNTGSGTTVAAAEGNTAAAMRGRPGTAKTRIVVTGDSESAIKLREALKQNPKIEVVEDLITVKVTKAADGSLSYEVSDAKTPAPAAKTAASVDQIAADVGAAANATPAP